MIDDLKLLELGTRVTFTHTLHRRRKSVRVYGPPDSWAGSPPGHEDKWWEAREDDPWGRPGVIVGRRTLADGQNRGYDGATFHPTRHFPAILIAYDLHRKPVLVLPEHVSLVERVTL